MVLPHLGMHRACVLARLVAFDGSTGGPMLNAVRILHCVIVHCILTCPSRRELKRLITGSRWSGPLFFGLKQRTKRGADDGAR
jgi:hypothetical protein